MSLDNRNSDSQPTQTLAGQTVENQAPLAHLQELAPALRVYEKNLLLRLDQLEQKLQANTLAIQALEARLHQELGALQQAQTLHTETLGKVDKIVRRGLWWRRLRALIGWLFLLAIVGGALYFYFIFDWRSLMSSLL